MDAQANMVLAVMDVCVQQRPCHQIQRRVHDLW